MKSRERAKVHQTMGLNWLRKTCRWPGTTGSAAVDGHGPLAHRERTDGPPKSRTVSTGSGPAAPRR